MRKSLLHGVIFGALGLVLASGLAHLSARLPTTDMIFRRGYQARIDTVLHRADAIEALAVGHSLNTALDFQALGMEGYHVWIMNSDLFETDHQVRTLAPHLDRLRLVFLPVGYNDFMRDNGSGTGSDRPRLYNYAATASHAPLRLIDGDWKHLVEERSMTLARSDHWSAFFEVLRGQSRANYQGFVDWIFPLRRYGYIGPNREAEPPTRKRLVEEAELREKQLKRTSAPGSKVGERAFRKLASTIAYLQQRDVRVVLYTPPMTDVLHEVYARSFASQIRRMHARVRRLQERFSILYLNYARAPAFAADYNLFMDAIHLNQEGARRFSQRFRAELMDRLESEERAVFLSSTTQ